MCKQFLLNVLMVVTGAVLLAAGGCAEKVIDLSRKSDSCGKAVEKLDLQTWRYVLSKYVKDGLIDYEGLAKDRGHLDRFVCQLAVHGPLLQGQMFADERQVLAYWINAYNALSLAAGLNEYPCESVYGRRGRFESRVLCKVDGRILTLREIRDLAFLAGEGDPRVLLTLSGPAMGCPKFTGQPYEAEKLDRQLRAAVQAALDNPKLVKIRHDLKALEVGGAIYDVKDRYVALYRDTFKTDTGKLVNSLMLFADQWQRRRLNTAIGYRVKLLQFDDKLNKFEEMIGC